MIILRNLISGVTAVHNRGIPPGRIVCHPVSRFHQIAQCPVHHTELLISFTFIGFVQRGHINIFILRGVLHISILTFFECVTDIPLGIADGFCKIANFFQPVIGYIVGKIGSIPVTHLHDPVLHHRRCTLSCFVLQRIRRGQKRTAHRKLFGRHFRDQRIDLGTSLVRADA